MKTIKRFLAILMAVMLELGAAGSALAASGCLTGTGAASAAESASLVSVDASLDVAAVGTAAVDAAVGGTVVSRATGDTLFTNNKIVARTQQEIIQYINQHPFYNASVGKFLADTYSTQPVYSGGEFVQGSLSQASLTYGLNAMNSVRFTAGLGEVSLSDECQDYAQAGTLLLAAIGKMTHTPNEAECLAAGVTKAVYDKGYAGTSTSNLGGGYSSIAQVMITGWMEDADSYNTPMVGHRRWVLYPGLTATGFGPAGNYTSMEVFGHGNTNWSAASGYTVVWPAANTPIEFFNTLGLEAPVWSVSKQDAFSSSTVVTLKRVSDGKTWVLKQGGTAGDFYINNEGYGQAACVIFRPSGVTAYNAGDQYTVTVTDGSYSLKYTVDFFSLPNNTGLIGNCCDTVASTSGHSYGAWTTTAATCTTAGSKKRTCSVCGKTETVTIAALGHSWKEPVWTWSGNSATAKFVCSNNSSHTQTVTASVTVTTTTATCGTEGKIVRTAKATFNGKTYTTTKNETSAKLSHVWQDPSSLTFTKESGSWKCYLNSLCANDSSHVNRQSIAITVSGNTVTFPKVTMSRTGYYFLGWATTKNATAAQYKTGNTLTLSSTLTLYPVWSIRNYKVTYYLGGGTNNPCNPATYKITSPAIYLMAPSKPGYVFEGWYTDAAKTKKSTGIAAGSINDRSFYAKFVSGTGTTRKLTFNSNGGTSGMPTAITAAGGSTVTVPASTPKRTGFWFLGWGLRSTDTTALYKSGSKIVLSTNVTLYAIWKPYGPVLTFNANGGTGSVPAALSCTSGGTVTIPKASALTRDGYWFLGWSTSKTATAATYKTGSVITLTGNITLYAVWKKK